MAFLIQLDDHREQNENVNGGLCCLVENECTHHQVEHHQKIKQEGVFEVSDEN